MLFDVSWAVSQIFSYDPFSWLAFTGIAFVAAYWGRWWGVIGGQALVAGLVFCLDAVYLEHHMPEMDADGIFAIGCGARALLINTTLIPLSALALWLSYRRRKAKPPTVQSTRALSDRFGAGSDITGCFIGT